tara:strand:- start:107 stop:394 length:288 start_codon:yes stop_codon:yes gene_type:complete
MPDNVYFNPRKAAEDVKKELTIEFDKKQKEMKKDLTDYELGQKILTITASLFLSPIVLMLLWNWLMPSLFGLATIGYLKAFGLHAMARILFHHVD